jgi:transposase-like protein
MDYTTCYCRSPQCPMYGQIAPRAHVKMHDWQRQGPRFRCARCGGIVSATTGTAYAGIRTDLTTYLRGATALAEGLSIRATGRLLDEEHSVILTLFADAVDGVQIPGQRCRYTSHSEAPTSDCY